MSTRSVPSTIVIETRWSGTVRAQVQDTETQECPTCGDIAWGCYDHGADGRPVWECDQCATLVVDGRDR